jgi:hypothetical protein
MILKAILGNMVGHSMGATTGWLYFKRTESLTWSGKSIMATVMISFMVMEWINYCRRKAPTEDHSQTRIPINEDGFYRLEWKSMELASPTLP